MIEDISSSITLPQQDMEVLKKNFPHCFDKNGDFDFEKFKKELSSKEINFSKESYGMDWLGKSYARLLATDPAKTLIREDREWNERQENKNSENLLVKGDNLEVLKHLSHAYHSKIKMIYIDPPYNTGSDGFVYEDDRKFSIEEFSELAGVDADQAKKILSFVNSSSNSHSAWLTFMYPRLYIARQLLKDDGVIFVSIDDNEVAQLRILMDEIFGEENFVGQFLWQTKNAARGVPPVNMLMENHEYIICFAKNTQNHRFQGIERDEGDFANPDNDIRGLWRSESMTATGGQNNIFEIVDPKTNNAYSLNWAFSKNRVEEMIREGLVLFPNEKNGVPRQKKFINTYRNEKKAFVTNLGWYSTENSTKYLMEMFNNIKIFSFPKPIELVKFLVNQQTNTNSSDLILDFFAGSGTTGDAVMQLNAEDRANGKEGNRKYILVQIPEKIDQKKNKTAFDFVKNEIFGNEKSEEPTIFEITKERLVRAGKKIGDTSGFKIFETTPIWEDYEFEAKGFDAQAKLFDESKLSSADLQTLLTTWKTYDNIPLTESLENVGLDGYVGYYGSSKLYLMDKGFETKHLKALLNKIDEDTNFNPVSIIVFGYHFESKALREISENVASYANKKKLDIDFITRY